MNKEYIELALIYYDTMLWNKKCCYAGKRLPNSLSSITFKLPSCFKLVSQLPEKKKNQSFCFQKSSHKRLAGDAVYPKGHLSSASLETKYARFREPIKTNIYRETTITLDKLSVLTTISKTVFPSEPQVITDKFFRYIAHDKDLKIILLTNASNFLVYGSSQTFLPFLQKEMRAAQPLLDDKFVQIILAFLPDFDVTIEGTFPYDYHLEQARISNNHEIFMEFYIEKNEQSVCYQVNLNAYLNDGNLHNPSWTAISYPVPTVSSASFN